VEFWLQDRMISWVKVLLQHLFKSCPRADCATLGIFRTFTEEEKGSFFHKIVTCSSSLTPEEDHSLHTAADY